MTILKQDGYNKKKLADTTPLEPSYVKSNGV